MALTDKPLIVFDGACGTNLQVMEIPASAWDGNDGCNEYLNLSSPETIVALHRPFVEAGAMVLETNTFGASSIVLAEYGLEARVEEINHRAVDHARTAIGDREVYVAGSVGPTTKLPSLNHISVDDLYASLSEQIDSLMHAGVDALVLETCQDLLQVKTALVCCFDRFAALGQSVPLLVSVTIERQGTMLVGSDIATVVTTIAPFDVFSLGLNCATGPGDMMSHIRYLAKHWPGRISCIPNQGLPEVVDGQTCYPMQPTDYAEHMRQFVSRDGVSVVGGCCGTTPAHIKALVEAVSELEPASREVSV
jgi:methionine synthase I (cobalamin-dependent)